MRAAEAYASLDFDRCLEQLAGYAYSELTRQLIRDVELVFHPARVDENLDQTAEALRFIEQHPSVPLPPFSQVRDLAPLWEAMAAGELIDAAGARDTRGYLEACAVFDNLGRFIRLDSFPRLADIAGPWQSQSDLLALHKRIFNDDGEVRDGASPALSEVRQKLRRFEGDVQHGLRDMLSEVREKSGEDALVSIRYNRFVVLLPRQLAGSYKGSIVDVSGSGHSVYFEPAAVSGMNTERQQLFLKEDQEVRRILRDYGIRLAAQLEPLKANLAILVRYDYIFARARYGLALHAQRPRLSREGGFALRGAVHPLIRGFVPETLLFEREKAVVISGVNAGGKTVLLKMLGLYSLLAALGCYTPGDCALPYISGLHADIGDEQSTLTNLSTFTAHLQFVSQLWQELQTRLPSEPPLLVLIDEIGTGTEPGEGAAFAFGLISVLLEHNVKLALTTHYDVLKTLAFERGDVKNVCLEFDETQLKPTYRILDNMPGQSYALAIAGRWGVDPQVLTRAHAALGQEERRMAAIIGELEQLRREAERAKAELINQQAQLRQASAENELLTGELKLAKQRFAQQAERVKVELERRIEELLLDTKRRLKKGAKRSVKQGEEYVKAASESAELVREQKQQAEGAVEAILETLAIAQAEQVLEPAGPLSVGGSAEMAASGVRGEVLEIDTARGEAALLVSGKRMTVKLSKLRPVAQAEVQKTLSVLEAYKAGVRPKQAAPALKLEESFAKGLQDSSDTIDLHGQTTEEAHESLEEFISNCLVANVNTIRVMHGVGTGRLRIFVQDYLRRHRHVKNIRHATVHEGGVGVTIAELK
jgi:DNA mismatch repair protein MutS2